MGELGWEMWWIRGMDVDGTGCDGMMTEEVSRIQPRWGGRGPLLRALLSFHVFLSLPFRSCQYIIHYLTLQRVRGTAGQQKCNAKGSERPAPYRCWLEATSFCWNHPCFASAAFLLWDDAMPGLAQCLKARGCQSDGPCC